MDIDYRLVTLYPSMRPRMQAHQIRFLKPLTGAKKPDKRAENLEIAHARSHAARVVHAKKA